MKNPQKRQADRGCLKSRLLFSASPDHTVIVLRLLFPHRYRTVVRAVAVGIEAGAWTNLNKALVECAARQADRSAYSKEARIDLGMVLVVVVWVRRHQVTEVAVCSGYAAMPLQFQTAHLNPRQYFACGKGIRPRPEPLPSYIDIVYVDFTVRRRFVI